MLNDIEICGALTSILEFDDSDDHAKAVMADYTKTINMTVGMLNKICCRYILFNRVRKDNNYIQILIQFKT